LSVDLAPLAGESAVEEIAGVELNARFGRRYLHHAPGGRLRNPGREIQPTDRLVQNEVVVIAVAEQELLVLFTDPRSDGAWLTEIHRQAFDGTNLAGRDEALVDRCEMVGIDLYLVAKDVAAACPSQVEVGVVGQIDDGRFVGRGSIIDAELVVLGEGVVDCDLEPSRIALVAVQADVVQAQPGTVRVEFGRRPPHCFVETHHTAVQVVSIVVACELVRGAVEREPAPGDAVAIPSDEGPEIGVSGEITIEGIESEHHV
jgi:hypothetical protein